MSARRNVLNRTTFIAAAAAFAAAVTAGACQGGKGLNFGCGPDDPCCARGTWYFDCKPNVSSNCGSCTPADYNTAFVVGPVTVSAPVARDGGTAYDGDPNFRGDGGVLFNVGTCEIDLLTTICRAPYTYHFGSNGPSLDIPVSCVTSSNTCETTCGSYTCTGRAQP
jgi:hypothetical protein